VWEAVLAGRPHLMRYFALQAEEYA